MEVAFLIGTPSFLLGNLSLSAVGFHLETKPTREGIGHSNPSFKGTSINLNGRKVSSCIAMKLKVTVHFNFLLRRVLLAGENASWKRLLLEMHAGIVL